MKGDDAGWFAPKAFGIGITPVAWQGWLLTIGYVATVIALDMRLRERHRALEVALVAILTIGFLAIAVIHTRGGMGWRWRGMRWGDGE